MVNSKSEINTHDLFNRSIIFDNVLDCIGGTPMVRLSKIAKEEGLECELLGKCEFFNPGGSIKDRIAKEMIDVAFKENKINKNTTLIEPTSGNTGVGLSLCGAILGMKTIMVLPEKMSNEKVTILKALGSKVIRTPTEAPYNAPESHLEVSKKINSEIKNSWIPSQYDNENNWKAHYKTTAEEILIQCDNKLDALVVGAGTGGTITGLSKRIKEVLPNSKIIGVDPVGSILAEPKRKLEADEDKPYLVEGIGYDFIPDTLKYDDIDGWIKTEDRDSLKYARKLIALEGLLCGGSSGSNLSAAIKVAKGLNKGQRVVVILPDTARNYTTKHLTDDWLVYNDIIKPDYSLLNKTIPGGVIDTTTNLGVIDSDLCPIIDESDTIEQLLKVFSIKNISHVAVVKKPNVNDPLFVVSNIAILSAIASGILPSETKISTIKPLITKYPHFIKPLILNHDDPLNGSFIKTISETGYAIIKPSSFSSVYPSLRIITTEILTRFLAKYNFSF